MWTMYLVLQISFSFERREHNTLSLAFQMTKAPVILKMQRFINFGLLHNNVPVCPYY